MLMRVFFQAGISKTGKSYHITNEETTPLVKRGWYNIKSGEKKTLKKANIFIKSIHTQKW